MAPLFLAFYFLLHRSTIASLQPPARVSLTRSGSQSTGGYQSISTLDNFHFTNVTPPYGRYSVGSNGSTEAYSPYWNNSGSTGSGSDSFIDYGSRQATPSSTTSVMMTTPVDNSFMPQQSKSEFLTFNFTLVSLFLKLS